MQSSCRSSAKANLTYWEATGLISSCISHCWSSYTSSVVWTTSDAVLLGLCMLPCGIQFRHVAGLYFLGNEFTSEWITKFSHQKEEVLRPDMVMHSRTLWKDSNAIGLVTVSAPVLEGPLTPGTAFSSAVHTHTLQFALPPLCLPPYFLIPALAMLHCCCLLEQLILLLI